MESQGEEVLPGVHYEVNYSATVPYRLVSECPDHDTYCVYPTDQSVPKLTCFRCQWILRRRQRPVVPVLRGPMPHRGIKDKEKRSRLLCLYLRPWVMLRTHATGNRSCTSHLESQSVCFTFQRRGAVSRSYQATPNDWP